MTRDCVVDASVGIKLFLVEEGSDAAHDLFGRLVAHPPGRLCVPDLFYAECGNILWKYVRRFGYPVDRAQLAVRDLSALRLYTVSTADLLGKAVDLALARDVTVYDACYAVLAGQLDIPLVTADQTLRRNLTGSGIRVLDLAAPVL